MESKNKFSRFTLILLITVMILPVAILGQESDIYFSFEESFALSVNGPPYFIITYIPRTFLFLIEDRTQTHEISSQEFLKAKTQDGVEVYVLENTISDEPFSRKIGNYPIIFNCGYSLCQHLGCDCEFDNCWQVNRGEAFRYEPMENGSILKLSTYRNGNRIDGYIGADELRRITLEGIVTHADSIHPKYSIARNELDTLELGCGEIRTKGYWCTLEGSGEEKENVRLVLKSFNLGYLETVGGATDVMADRNIGVQGRTTRFFVYDVTNQRNEHSFRIAAAVTYACSEENITGGEPQQVVSVQMFRTDNGRSYELRFDEYKFPDNLKRYLYAPYLFSVNNYTQYKNLLKRLSKIFEDRSLAACFMAEFNISARYEDRLRFNPTIYDYK